MKSLSKSKKSTDLKAFCRALKDQDNILLACHIAPEGDAIGSILAMDSLLKRLGKKTTVVAEDSFPERLFCLSSKRWKRMDEIKKKGPYQALVVADCPNLERIGKVRDFIGPETVIFNIDHHVSNVHFGQYNYVLPKAAASGEVVYDIFQYFKLPLTKEEATSLYVAISTDTGSFKYGNTTANSHKIAIDLMKTGIDIEKINDDLYATYSLNKINLYSRLLGRVKTAAQGKVAWVCMKREDIHHTGATYEDTEGFIDFLKYLREVKIAFFASELEKEDAVRVSFRSKDSYDVNHIATSFNGGGHKKAAGCILRVPIEKAEEMILERLKKDFPSL
jgi:bifunctional oligoribonuclease and PAP phosphatase NrnA